MELEQIKGLIQKHAMGHSAFLTKAETAERYYRNQNDVLWKDKEKDSDETPLRNADNRISRNFHGLLVNQKAAYAFTASPLFDVGSKTANKRIAEVLGDSYGKICMELCINAANTAVGWLHYWEDDDGAFQYAVVDSKQIIPIFSTDLQRRLLAVLRVYSELDETDGEIYTVYEYWTDAVCQSYRCRSGADGLAGLSAYAMFRAPDGTPAAEASHTFGAVPFIPFFNNNLHTDDLQNVKPLIDVYDKVYSGFINDLEDVQELIFILSGYGGEDLNGFLQELKKYKVIKLDPDDDGKAGVDTLSIEIPIEARNSVLDATRRAIFEQGFGFDPQPESFGNQSGVALKFMYALLEMKAGLMQKEFEVGFARLVRAICSHERLSCGRIIQTWTRTSIRNDSEQADICQKSVGIVSRRTILRSHPLVEDVDAELKQLQKEADEALGDYAGGLDHQHTEPPEDDA